MRSGVAVSSRSNTLSAQMVIGRGLVTATLFFAFFPFVSPFPMETDIQPIFFGMAALCLLSIRGKVRFIKAFVFLPVILMSLIYFSDYRLWSAIDSLRLLFAAIAFAFFLQYHRFIGSKLIFYCGIVNILICGVHFFFPSFFVSVFGSFVRVIKITEIGFRGASGLSPEPGFSGAVMVAVIAAATLRRELYNDEYRYYLLLLATLVGVAMTRSGTGFLYLVTFYFLYLANLRRFVFMLPAVGVVIMAIAYIDLGRGSVAFLSILMSPRDILLVDASIGTRVLNVMIGVLSVLFNPFGFGFGSYDESASFVAQTYGLRSYVVGNIGTISAFALYSVAVGLIWWITLFFLLFPAVFRLGFRALPYLGLVVIFIVASFSIAFPLTWMLLAMCLQAPRNTADKRVVDCAD